MRTVRHPKPILVAFATLLLASLASTVAELTLDYSFEYNTDRSGSDYRNCESGSADHNVELAPDAMSFQGSGEGAGWSGSFNGQRVN